MLTDLEIAHTADALPIGEVAGELGISPDEIIPYGRDKAKLPLTLIEQRGRKRGKLVLVTATNPTPAGEGKTTVSIGLADALRRLGHRSCAALREPSLGPVFGIKGGAAGGGYAQVIPMEEINLHFTGDLHAVTASNNLICAMTDNAAYQGTVEALEARRIVIPRCMDMNDRELRHTVAGLGRPVDGIPREDGFVITAASEIMAILCLARNLSDLRERIARVVVAWNSDGTPVTAGDVRADGAAALLLKDAVMPNLVQTLEHTPALVHGGPFANIAHGCSSVVSLRMGLTHAEYTVTEAGFGADLGAEKFLDIMARDTGLWPNAVVLVTTIRSLKHHGGAPKHELSSPDVGRMCAGLPNLERHLRNLKEVYGLPVIVAVNRFASDTDTEVRKLGEYLDASATPYAVCTAYMDGGKGAEDLARLVTECSQPESAPRWPYAASDSILDKVSAVAAKIYGASGTAWEPGAAKAAARAQAAGYGSLPVCIAKTQYSFSDNPALLGAPSGFTLTVRDLQVSAGAGFLVAVCGDIMRMPGLSREPAANAMDVDADGRVTGLF